VKSSIQFQPAHHTITFDAALRDLEHKDPRVRAAAAHALGSVEEPGEVARAARGLLGVLADARSEVRATAAMSLGELGDPSACEALENRLDDGDPAVRQTAAIALGRIGAARSLPRLRQALELGPADLRFQAATTLVEIDPAAAYEPLVAALTDTDSEVLGAVALGLGQIGDNRAAGHLAELLDHDNKKVRFDAAYALSQLGDKRATGELSSHVEDRALGWDAIEALEGLGDRQAVGALAKAWISPRTPRPLRLRAAAAVLALDPEGDEVEAARRVLEGGLRAWKLEHRGLAVELVGKVGGPWAEDLLRALRSRRAGKKLRDEIDQALNRGHAPPH
jgi:HEAT repeat protein